METNISTVQVVLMGLITVFVVLICLIVIIKILGLIMEKVAKKQPAPAEEMGTDVSHIRIHSIKRI